MSSSSSLTHTRKRPYSQLQTAEERREARAQRNRIAAQCSRDRKKAEFEILASKVEALEEENNILRSGKLNGGDGNATRWDELEKENKELKERFVLDQFPIT
jgi:uncharacterized membrane protein YqiK